MNPDLRFEILKFLQENNSSANIFDFINRTPENKMQIIAQVLKMENEGLLTIAPSERFNLTSNMNFNNPFSDEKEAMVTIESKGIDTYLNLFMNYKNINERNPHIHIGDNFSGNLNTGDVNGDLNQESFRKEEINPTTHTTNNTNAAKPSKRSPIEILYWIAGIVVAVIAIYELYTKLHPTK